MRIGVVLPSGSALHSLRHVWRDTSAAVGMNHESLYLPRDFAYYSGREQADIAKPFIHDADVIIGLFEASVLAGRRNLGSDTPYISFVLGSLTRGAFGFMSYMEYLNSNDTFVVNCQSELPLAKKYFNNVTARVVPFAYDEQTFFPLEEEERAEVRQRLGFGTEDRILLYVGRISIEKNVITVLRVFSAVCALIPRAHLILAGQIDSAPFAELGIHVSDLERTLDRAIAALGISRHRVWRTEELEPGQLRELYGIADATLNLTLNHDENFGLAQVESMACGTPVVGSAWGGLKDTIVPGISGYKVSTASTQYGVTVNWWEAVNRAVQLMRDAQLRACLRASGAEYARTTYSSANYQRVIDELLYETHQRGKSPAEPLTSTRFAREFWRKCRPQALGIYSVGEVPPYRRSSAAAQLYRELMLSFTEESPESVPESEPLEGRQILVLAAPISVREGGHRLDSALYPFEVEVPSRLCRAFGVVAGMMQERPVTTVKRITEDCVASKRQCFEVLDWMVSTGLLLRNWPVEEWLKPEAVHSRSAEVVHKVRGLTLPDEDFLLHGTL